MIQRFKNSIMKGLFHRLRYKGPLIQVFYIVSTIAFVGVLASWWNFYESSPILSRFSAVQFLRRPQFYQQEHPDANDERENLGSFLVYSNSCQIPNTSPLDKSVIHLINYNPPIDCSRDYPAGSYVKEERLFIDFEIIKKYADLKEEDVIACCYRKILRIDDGESDNHVDISRNCVPFLSGDQISEEFIKVECGIPGQSALFVNYHAFVPEKEDVEQRCHKSKTSDTSETYNVLIIGIDAVSRLNFHRQFRKTLSFMKNQLNAIEMYGYNKVGENTFPNLIALTTGFHDEELPKVCWPKYGGPLDECPFIWKKFAKHGYRTFYAEDTPKMSSFNFLKKGFLKQPTDYYFRPLILPFEKELGRRKDLFCTMCVGAISETEAVLGWTKQFIERFHNRSFFALSWINSGTHDYLNYGSMYDGLYQGYLNYLHSRGLLNTTILIIMSDHGIRWGDIQQTHIGKMENRLPILLLAFPEKFRKAYANSLDLLKENSRRLITPYDLHATLNNIINFNGSRLELNISDVPKNLSERFKKRGLSLFGRIAKERSCVDADIAEHWCTCNPSKEVLVSDKTVIHIAKFLVSEINKKLNDSDQCEELSLREIKDARIRTTNSEVQSTSADSLDNHISLYTVTVKTLPGEALFEGTVKLADKKGMSSSYNLVGEISRLTIYGDQSHCVRNAILKKYCYCKVQLHSHENS